MANINVAAFPDLIKTGLDNLPMGEVEMMWDDPNYPFVNMINKSKKSATGNNLTRNVILDTKGRAQFVSLLYGQVQPTRDQLHKQITVPWTRCDTSWIYDEIEVAINRSPQGFIDLLASVVMERTQDIIQLIEASGMQVPDSSTDNTKPYGIPYYLNLADAGTAATTNGFIGQTIRYGDGTTGTTCAGLDASANPKWKSYVRHYTKVDNGFLRAFQTAMRETRVKPAPGVPDMSKNRGFAPIGFCNGNLYDELVDLLDKRKDTAASGSELMAAVKMNEYGQLTIWGIPIEYSPSLDTFTVRNSGNTADVSPNPLFVVNRNKFQTFTLDGFWGKKSNPIQMPLQPHVFMTHVDYVYQNLCTNRREAGFVLHKVIA